jgi:general secretion pathway protein J
MSRPGANRGAGFTLVELLVAVLAFTLLAAAAYSGLDALTAATAAQRERADRLAELQRAVATMDADLRQLVSRLGRDREGRSLPALVGRETTLLGRRAGRPNPAGLPRSQLQQVRWRETPDGLVRETWAGLDTPPSEPPVGAARFDVAGTLRLRYRDAVGNWHRDWPVGGRPRELPSAVEYVLDAPPFGRVRRLVAL